MALVPKFSEVITVSGTAIGITSTNLVDSNGRKLNVIMCRFQHKSGGKINYSDSDTTPGQGASTAEWSAVKGTEWNVWGDTSLTDFRMIKQTGEADGVIVAHGYGN